MRNDFEKNKRVFPAPYEIKASAPIPLPPADKGTTGGKGPGQDGWESLDGVAEGPVQAIGVGTRVRLRNKLGHIGTVAQQANDKGFYRIDFDNHVSWAMKRDEFEPIDSAVNDMNNEGPVQRTRRYIATSEARRVPRWPDSGISMPINKPGNFDAALARGMESLDAIKSAAKEAAQDALKVIFPREIGEDGILRDKKIHSVSLSEDLDRTSIDKDDMNNWGGLEDCDNSEFAEAILALGNENYTEDDNYIEPDIGSSVESEDDRYATGNVYRTEGFYSNLFSAKTSAFEWALPGVLAFGPHPIFTSHLEDLTELKRAGFKAILSLFDKPLDQKYVEGFQYLHIPTVEGFSCELQRICKFLSTQESLDNPVFIHSLHGKGRVGTALAAYFLYKKWLNGAKEAMNFVKQNFGEDAIETVYQEDALLKFMLDE